MKYFICFGSSSIALLVLKQQECEVGSLLGINIPYRSWKKNSVFNISGSTHSKDPLFRMHMDILDNFDWVGKSSVEASEKEIFRFNWRIGPKYTELQLPQDHVWACTYYKIV